MYRVLHVEDNEGDIILTKEAFKNTSVKVDIETAVNGIEALEKLTSAESLPHLVLLDINMPQMNGKEFLKELRSKELYNKVPVVMLTTSNADIDIIDCYNLKANAYVTKDQDFSGFLDSIQKIAAFWLGLNTLPGSLI